MAEPTDRDFESARELLSDGIYAETFTRVAIALAEARADGAREKVKRVRHVAMCCPTCSHARCVMDEFIRVDRELARAAEAGVKDENEKERP